MSGQLAKKPMRSALGRGLSALISSPSIHQAPPAAQEPPANNAILNQNKDDRGIKLLNISEITRNPEQPRKDFSDAELQSLANSIKSVGIIQPITVRPNTGADGYQIVAGERRFRAAQIAGLTQVPVIIDSFFDKDALEVALIENIQRENLNPIEEALAYKKLMDEFSYTQQQLAERVGKERATVANILRLLSLPDQVVQMIREGKLSMGHAKAVLSVKEPSAQISLAKKVLSEDLSVRALEGIVSRVVVLDTGKKSITSLPAAQSTELEPRYSELLERLRRELGTKVALRQQKSGKGKIEIDYFSDQELERLVDHLCR